MLLPGGLLGQKPDWKSILERLDRLERQNRLLRAEVNDLRNHLAALRSPPEFEESLDIHERRIQEHAQTKVESSQRFPLRVTGMALFNVFLNSRLSGGRDNPPLASRTPGAAAGGATFRQTVLGLQYQGPSTIWGGKVRGSLFADFFGAPGGSLNHQARIRTASIEVDWTTRSILVGQEKPIFAPREPNSLSQVGISPLSGAGNLWLWQPQVRFEQRFRLGENTRLRAQLGFVQTSEDLIAVPDEYSSSVARRRPGLEGRFQISHAFDETRRIEIAPGFHTSTTHVLGGSVPSSLFALDWFANPWPKLEFTGAFFSGQNIGQFGAPRQGFTFAPDHSIIPVHSRGGWTQFTWLATPRLSLNIMGGRHDDRNSDLLPGNVGKNSAGAANLMYRLSPNVLLSLEASQVRTDYLGTGNRINNHYDLAVAYLF
jgi:hypothetical protein